MARNNKQLWIGILIFAIIIFFFLGNSVNIFSSVGGTVTRITPVEAEMGNSFLIRYSASGTGAFGVSIVDSVSGGCTFPDGTTEYKEVILSDDSSRTVIVTAPDSETTCYFSGDYKFGTQNIVNMANANVDIVKGATETGLDGDGGDVLEDSSLNNIASNILGLEDTPAKQAKLYVFLFWAGAALLLFLIIKLITTTPK